ncbi:MAG: hypothetical protein M3Z37_00180 [Candidatus Eremiobacteraeota bacterium]|nr:hypothetical protein [Candidatus Eremiobacteraeota bacterium]
MQRRIFFHARAARAAILAVSLLALSSTDASAAGMKMGAATPPPRPSAAESAFVGSVTRALQAKFGDVQAAENAGYYRTTRLEPDGTIIYFNNQWRPTRLAPNFLWYDKHGKLAGLDYQYPVAGHPQPPGASAYPVAASRWTTIDPHIHYGYQLPDGIIVRKGYRMLPSVHGNVLTEAELRQAKLLPPNAKLLWTYVHPKSWDLGFWLVPNPNGAFAEMNPNIKP